jgi:hypothetical protein
MGDLTIANEEELSLYSIQCIPLLFYVVLKVVIQKLVNVLGIKDEGRPGLDGPPNRWSRPKDSRLRSPWGRERAGYPNREGVG